MCGNRCDAANGAPFASLGDVPLKGKVQVTKKVAALARPFSSPLRAYVS